MSADCELCGRTSPRGTVRACGSCTVPGETLAKVRAALDIRTRARAWMEHLGYTGGEIDEAEQWRAPLDPFEDYEVPAGVRDLEIAAGIAREYEELIAGIILDADHPAVPHADRDTSEASEP